MGKFTFIFLRTTFGKQGFEEFPSQPKNVHDMQGAEALLLLELFPRSPIDPPPTQTTLTIKCPDLGTST